MVRSNLDGHPELYELFSSDWYVQLFTNLAINEQIKLKESFEFPDILWQKYIPSEISIFIN